MKKSHNKGGEGNGEMKKRREFSEKERKEVKMSYYVETLEDLIRIDTSVPPGKNYEVAIGRLEAEFRRVGCRTERIIIPPEYTRGLKGPRVNLLAHREVSGKPHLWFYTHIDTVPVRGWNGFRPRVEDGRVYGRGAADMKGAIVALLLALAKIGDRVPAWDISVMVTTDEEMLGQQAAQLEYLGQIQPSLQGAYIWDLDSDAGFIGIAGLGAIQMEIEVSGKTAHSAKSHLGVNAVEQAFLLMDHLRGLKKRVVQRKSKIPVHPDEGLETMVPRLNINVFQGGWKANVVPERCRISIDRRLIPEEDLDEAEAELMNALFSVKEVNWAVRRILKIPSYASDDPIADQLVKILEKVTGQKISKYGGMGSSDLPGVAVKWGAKVFGLGVFRPENNIHGKEEFVYLKDIEDLSEVIVNFLLGGWESGNSIPIKGA
ncbi:MAG: M20/M25/M40 family metallo-hydrolase [Candidatus Nealsonbacteria bacterium]|nr:MAG: M20/M25/M40 family metallo-hydrolase [Candidatus Nealsonbacteria bacterium]